MGGPRDLPVRCRRTFWSPRDQGHVEQPARRSGDLAPQRLRLPAALAAVSDVRDVRSSGHEHHAGRRNVSTVPTQALTLLNNPFVLRQAELLAERITSETRRPGANRSISRIACALGGPRPIENEACARESQSAVAGRFHPRAVEPERISLHEVTPCTT